MLARELAVGLPGWQSLDSTTADRYQQEIALWEGLDRDFDDADELGTPSDTVDYALALMHASRNVEALEVTQRLIQQLQSTDPDADSDKRSNVISAHAYALARNGRVKDALALAVPEIRTLSALSLYEQCELLHLLGDLMHWEGKWAAAARYFLQERALRPPALHRRLHNRSHLLDMLVRENDDPDLIAQIAVEGLGLSYAAESPSDTESFASTLVDYAGWFSEDRCESILAEIQRNEQQRADESEPPAATRQAVAIALIAYRTVLDELDAEERTVLENQLSGAGALKAFACYRLAGQPRLPVGEKIRLLRLGADESCRHGVVCLVSLLDALWEAEDWRGLGEHATAMLSRFPADGQAHAALCASAYHDGRRSDAVEHYARALCYKSGFKVFRAAPRLFAMLHADMAFWREGDERLMGMLVELADQLEQGTDSAECAVPGMSLSQVIDRLYEYTSHIDPVDPWLIRRLIRISENAWDRANYLVAINARRRACQLIEKTEDAAWLAEELGWLASLVKQAGNIEEALSLYQRAIAGGRGVLSQEAESSLLGRYANLLHQIGDFEPAVRAQWLAVLAQKQQVSAVGSQFPPQADKLDDALSIDGIDPDGLPGWATRSVNLANCFQAAGYSELAARALRSAVIAIEAADAMNPKEMARPQGAEMKRLFERVRKSVEVSGIDVTAIEVPSSWKRP